MSSIKEELVIGDFAQDLETIASIDAIPNILEVICRSTGLGFAAVARVTEDRWIACAVRDEIEFGLQAGGELKVATTICDEIRVNGQVVVIDHVAEDEAFCNHPTPRMYGFQSYISVPIRLRDGRFFGTLCAIDPKPAQVNTPATVGMFKLFADLIAVHLDSQERLQVSEKALIDERLTARLREEFIAVLGHDLRNPLNAINNGTQVLSRMLLNEEAKPVVAMVQRSAARMAGLIVNLMDFARGRLGGGLSLRPTAVDLEPILEQIISEERSAWPDRTIQTEITLGRSVTCDSVRIAQMFSNLLANALTHGDPDGPIKVWVHSDDAGLRLTITNFGKRIPHEIVERLFQPFYRAAVRPDQDGLGLGLYIASEIARAHSGSLVVSSSDTETSFTFQMPLVPVSIAATSV